MSRLNAKQISTLKPLLDANNVKLVGIGFEERGVEEFVEYKFFSGDLYIDLRKNSYKKLGFKRLNCFTMLIALLSKKSRASYSESKKQGIHANLVGDVMQKGGALVVDKGGKALMVFKQKVPGHYMDPNDVLVVLGLDKQVDNAISSGSIYHDNANKFMSKK